MLYRTITFTLSLFSVYSVDPFPLSIIDTTLLSLHPFFSNPNRIHKVAVGIFTLSVDSNKHKLMKARKRKINNIIADEFGILC